MRNQRWLDSCYWPELNCRTWASLPPQPSQSMVYWTENLNWVLRFVSCLMLHSPCVRLYSRNHRVWNLYHNQSYRRAVPLTVHWDVVQICQAATRVFKLGFWDSIHWPFTPRTLPIASTCLSSLVGTLKELGAFFNSSASRNVVLKDICKTAPASGELSDQKAIKIPSMTRWTSLDDCLHTFLKLCPSIVDALEKIVAEFNDPDTRSKARNWSKIILDFELVLVEHVSYLFF